MTADKPTPPPTPNSRVLAEVFALGGKLRGLEERVDSLDALRESVSSLARTVEGLAPTSSKDNGGEVGVEVPPAFVWCDLDQAERDRWWPQLLGWVDGVLRGRMAKSDQWLAACWHEGGPDAPAHPQAVDAVTAAWTAWETAHRGKDRKPQDPGLWRRDHLAGLQKELGVVFRQGRCDKHPAGGQPGPW